METTSVAVTIIFHDDDVKVKEKIVKHLRILERNGEIELWQKGLVLGGENTSSIAKLELDRAEIALFLISVESIASDEIWKEEVGLSLERHRQGRLIFIPVIVRDCQWKDTNLSNFKPLPEDGKPIYHWPHLDIPCKQVADAVKQHVKNISRQKQSEHKQQGIVPPEFQEIDTIFQKMPDEKVMKHMSFADHEGKPASAVHFAIYAEMLRKIRINMSEREEYNFYFNNLEDARKVEEIANSILERSELLEIDTISLGIIAQDLEDASRKFRLDFGSPEHREDDNWQSAKMMFVEPFCEVILNNEKKLNTLSRFSINIDLTDISSN